MPKLLNLITFANDTNIYYLDDYPRRLVDTLNVKLEKLSKLFKINNLLLNVSKSNFIVLSKIGLNVSKIEWF